MCIFSSGHTKSPFVQRWVEYSVLLPAVILIYGVGRGVSLRPTQEYPEICEQYLYKSRVSHRKVLLVSSLPALQKRLPPGQEGAGC